MLQRRARGLVVPAVVVGRGRRRRLGRPEAQGPEARALLGEEAAVAPPDDEELPGAHGEAQAPLGRAPVPPPRLELGELAQRAPELAEVRPLLLAGLVFHVPHAREAGANVAEEAEVIRPKHLRRSVAKRLRKAARRYEG